MPIIYETTATIAPNGHLHIDIDDLPFDSGTEFVVKLIPQVSTFNPERFKQRMQTLIDNCAKQSPYQGMDKFEILTLLREQREDMYGEHDQD